MKQIAGSFRGPVSRKVLEALEKELRRKVISFEAFRLGAERAADLERGIVSEEKMRGMDPLHAVYTYAQNKLSAIVEDVAQLPMCAELAEAYSAAEEEYLPSGPPMSPLTRSYFFCWAVFDSHVGKDRETLATVAIDLRRRLGMEPSVLRLFEYLQGSRMGLYVHEGHTGTHVMLREFITGTTHRCAVPAGYRGRPGEIWYVRVLPEPFESMGFGYSLVFPTPYVISRQEAGRFVFADPQDWVAFFSPTWSHMNDYYPQTLIQTGMQEAWQRAPVTMEACWVMQHWRNQGWDLDHIIDESLKWHISSFNAKSSPVPQEWWRRSTAG